VAVAVGIVFETHSLTTDNEAGVATGWLDGQLSERGRALAGELGRRRRHAGIAAVFASDLGRAVQTVELAFSGSGIPVHLDARLRECDYGAWNGMPVSRLERERARVLVIGHTATRWALDHLLAGADLAELVVAPFGWRKGWTYELPAGWQRPGLAVGSADP
jgi:broad specificity phosphatase PhoE